MAIKPNFKIFTLRFVTEELLSQFMPKIKELEAKTDTEISFNYNDQFFDIKGETQNGCDEATDILNGSLIPILCEDIMQNQLTATYEDVTLLKTMKITHIHKEEDIDDDATLRDDFIIIGKPLTDHHEDDDEKGYTLEEFNYAPDIVTKQFDISPLIRDIKDFMIGPLQFNMQPAEYEDIIPRLTNITDCFVKGRSIIISGEESCVDDAMKRFQVFENNYIAHLKVDTIVCIHYPRIITGHYALYFCNLSSYRHKSFVHLLTPKYTTIHVLLPVFPDEAGEYGKPKDLIGEHVSTDMRRQQVQDEFNARFRDLSQYTKPRQIISNTINSQYYPNHDTNLESSYKHNNSSSNSSTQYEQNTTTDNNNYNNKNSTFITTNTSPIPTTKRRYRKNSIPTSITTDDNDDTITQDSPPASCMEYIVPVVPTMDENNFPLLPPPTTSNNQSKFKPKRSFSPSLNSNDQPRINRVLRIIPQKTTNQPLRYQSMTERVRSYNYNNIKTGLVRGLNLLKGFKGEIELSAKIGKVLWNNVSSNVNSKIWNYHEINDIVMKELNAFTEFTNITTIHDQIIDHITSPSVLGYNNKPFNRTAIFEFHCLARNQPSVPYTPTIIHMNQGVIDVRKVVLKETPVTEVNWVSLDRKFDFKLSLEAKTLTRCDVKPYTTFIKRVSICPISCIMTFEQVPRFLKVDFILLKQTTRYRVIHPFVVEITRVEQVPTSPVENTIKYKAVPGTGRIWYEYQVKNVINETAFEANKELELGKEAPWKTEDILGIGEEGEDTITQYVKCMLIIIEKIEKAIANATIQNQQLSPIPSSSRNY